MNPKRFEVYRDLEVQSHAVDESSLYDRNDELSYAAQSNIIQPAASDEDPNALVLYENTEDHAIDTEEPSGRYYFDEHQSHDSVYQSHVDQELRGMPRWEDEVSSYATEHSYIRSFAAHHTRTVGSSVVPGGRQKKKRGNSNTKSIMSHTDEQQSYTTQSQSHAVQDPRGTYGWDDETSSYITELPSTRTQPFTNQPHSVKSVVSSVLPGGPKRKKKKKKRRGSQHSMPHLPDGVNSQTDSDNDYYGHSNTFYV